MIRKDRIILLVEDNADDVELARRAFEKTNIASTLVVVRDGQEALDYLLAGGPGAVLAPITPDVVLLDLKLPKIDGLEVLRRIRADEKLKRLPVVILTTSNEEKDLIDSYDLGANSYVRKPVDFLTFVEAARQLGTYWLLLNEAPPPAPPG